jgi:predicted nuclease of predicted toxin-antitoxin system
MKIVADESVDFGIVQLLRQKGIPVISISEESSGITDVEVLVIAVKNQSLLITEDKDFGELTYRLKLEHRGILLIRLGDLSHIDRIEVAAQAIEKHFHDLFNNFSVLDKRGIRVKTARVRSRK